MRKTKIPEWAATAGNVKKIKIITPSNIEIEYWLAGAGSRFGAFVIDSAVQSVLFTAFALAALYADGWAAFGTSISERTAAVILTGFFAIYFGYYVLLEYAMQGRTVGKRLLGLRTIRDNGEPAGFAQILVRGFLRSAVDIVYVGIFVIMFSGKNKRLGDLAAGTVVIIERTGKIGGGQKKGAPPPFMAPAEPWPGFFPDPYSLAFEEKLLADEFLRRKAAMPDKGRALEIQFAKYFLESKARDGSKKGGPPA